MRHPSKRRKRPASRPAPASAPAAVVQCTNADDGRRPWCLGAAAVQRGTLPLCSECEARSSSLTRLPLRPLGAPPPPPSDPLDPTPAELDRTLPPADGSRPWATPQPVTSTPYGPLYHLARCRQSRDSLERRQATWVAAARAEGLSWAKIGDALGVSAVAVHKRYRDPAS